jgi:flagellar FliL protein
VATQAAKATADVAAASAAASGGKAAKDKKAEGAAAEAAPAKRKFKLKLKLSKKMMIILLAAFILIAGIGGGLWFFLGRHPDGEAAAGSDKALAAKGDPKSLEKAAAAKREEKKKKPVEYMSGDPYYTVNLSDEDNDRYLQLGLVFEVSDPKAAEELKEKMPAVRSSVLFLLSSKKSRELMPIEGKKQLASEILALTRKALDTSPPDNGIDAVDFSIFVIQ